MFNQPDPKQSFPKLEEALVEYWRKNNIFVKSVEKDAPEGDYVFYDGPPFATGLPHYGHILASTLKDVIPRYFTMRGFRVERRWGWDCHGLPVENLIEGELNLSEKKAILEFGIDNFNEACRTSVLRYAKEWGKVVERMGRWIDFENSYKTMDPTYMETIWWVFKTLWDKKLIYKGRKSMHICPRCETPLSNFEVGQGYKDIIDISVTVKLYLVDEPDTAILVWTTTPWTLPGNAAAAIGADVDYVKVKVDNEFVILAKEALSRYFPQEEQPQTVDSFKGKALIGKKYKPLYDFFDQTKLKNTFTVYEADFVTTTDGSGVVHIAPGFGEDDMQLSQKAGIPFIQHIGIDGKFVKQVTPFAGKDAKKSDPEIAKDLASKNLLFREQKYKHSYPHCWRCDTPLLNYATDSWFVDIGKVKSKMIESNQKINWVPAHLKDGRFGKWLEGARDWAISRNRFWGAPLPVWQCDSCDEMECLGSMEDLRERLDKEITRVVFLRHGESEGNLTHLRQSQGEGTRLTQIGEKQAHQAAQLLKNGPKIDVIITSPLKRTRQTADIIANALGGIEIIRNENIREINFGSHEGKTDAELQEYMEHRKKLDSEGRYTRPVADKGAESHEECEKRVVKEIKNIIDTHKGKNILIVTHSDPIRFAERYFHDHSLERTYSLGHKEYATPHPNYIVTKTKKLLDLHKHFVDDMRYNCKKCKGKMKRIEEVLDCWFESGAMPYAQSHYPFENKEWFEKNFPAQFIAEGLDQTRGWFYTLTVLSAALFNEPAFQNVIVNGIVLAEDGRKMSKRLKNYPDPNHVFNTYGADAMRFYLMNSPVVKADDLRFSEKGVEEVVRNIILPFWNSYSFFVTYANIDNWQPEENFEFKIQNSKFSNKLDKWIVSELNEVLQEMTTHMNLYDLQKSTDAVLRFLDNLTNWYIRRSRRRFWKSENDSDKNNAYGTLYYVLVQLSKMFAPFMPFVSEEAYRNLTNRESVHLAEWPKADKNLIDANLNQEIAVTRTIVALGHGARAKERIKVRQPLPKIEVALPEKISQDIIKEQIEVIIEELNVKELIWIKNVEKVVKVVAFPNGKLLGPKLGKDVQAVIQEAKKGNFEKLKNGNIKVLDFELSPEEIEIRYEGKEGQNVESDRGIVVILDTKITEELKLEGLARDLIRRIQDLRKNTELNVDDRIKVGVVTDDADIKKAVKIFKDYIQKETLADKLEQKSVHPKQNLVENIEGAKVEFSLEKM